MYYDLIKFPIRHEKLQWEAREVLLDVHGVPHLFLRIRMSGTEFPLLAKTPQVWIGNTPAKHVLISENKMTVRAYFSPPYPEGGEIFFGHLGVHELQFGRFSPSSLARLDRERLPENVVLGEKPLSVGSLTCTDSGMRSGSRKTRKTPEKCIYGT
jgi:hypothetical protein